MTIAMILPLLNDLCLPLRPFLSLPYKEGERERKRKRERERERERERTLCHRLAGISTPDNTLSQ